MPGIHEKVFEFQHQGFKILFGFCGVMAFNKKNTIEHFKSLEKDILGMIASSDYIANNILKNYFYENIKNAKDIGQERKDLKIHFINQMDYSSLLIRQIVKINIDFRNGKNDCEVTTESLGSGSWAIPPGWRRSSSSRNTSLL